MLEVFLINLAVLFNHLITLIKAICLLFLSKVYRNIKIGSLIASINYLNFGISINDFK